MNIFKIDKSNFYSQMLLLALPIAFQNLINASLIMIDQIMIGKLGETAIAGVGFGMKLSVTLLFILFGLGSGVAIFTAQFWGKGDTKNLGQVMGVAMFSGLILLLIFSLPAYFFSEEVVSLFTRDSEVIKIGAKYQRIIIFMTFPLLITALYSSVLKGAKIVKIPVMLSISSVLINTVLNYLLIFGKFGFPELGFVGAGIATVIAKWLEALGLLIIIYSRKLPGAISIKSYFNISYEFLKKFYATLIPIITAQVLWTVGETIYSIIYGRMGTSSAAAVMITYPLQGMLGGFFAGLSAAAAIMLGNSLGKEDYDHAYETGKKFIITTFWGTNVAALIAYFFINSYIALFNISLEVQIHTRNLLIVFLILMFTRVLTGVILEGIIKSGGKTKFNLNITIIGTWLIGLPLGFITAFVFKLPVHLVYLAISMNEISKMLFGLYIFRSKKWANNLVNEFV